MVSLSSRIEREKKTVQAMIEIYCRDNHKGGKQLCADCGELAVYAKARLLHCPFGEEKPACVNCPVHCYKPEKRDQVRKVMRYAGPRMILYHPILSIFHLLDKKRNKHDLK